MSTPAIEIKGLKKVYANGFEALKGIDLTINRGDFFALLGPNGAGKSTTIGIITTLANMTEGSVQINGADLSKKRSLAKSYLGVVPQEINLNIFEPPMQVLINQASFYGVPRSVAKKRAEELLKLTELWDKRDTQVRMLSGGMKRRLMVARALIHQPEILILDEPTAGVDVEIRQNMWKVLNKLNKNGLTILLTTHYLEEAESLCDQVAIINHGQIVKNCPMKELLGDLEMETLIFYLAEPLKKLPNFKNFASRQMEADVVEVDLVRGTPLTEVFHEFCEHKIQVTSMRNKANRLEQLFINLIQGTK